MTTAHYCPVCWRPVDPTPHQCIFGHYDRVRNLCPGSYEPFYIVITEKEPRQDLDFGRYTPKWWPKRRFGAKNGQNGLPGNGEISPKTALVGASQGEQSEKRPNFSK